MNSDMLNAVREEIKTTIKETVNGKIDRLDAKMDKHNKEHSDQMLRILPVLEAYEASERAVKAVQFGGKAVLWIATSIAAIGGAWLVIKQIWPSI